MDGNAGPPSGAAVNPTSVVDSMSANAAQSTFNEALVLKACGNLTPSMPHPSPQQPRATDDPKTTVRSLEPLGDAPTIHAAFAHFLALSRSAATRRTYHQILTEWAAFMASMGLPEPLDLRTVREEHMLHYRVWLDGRHTLPGSTSRRIHTTIAKKLCCLRSFFCMLERRRVIDENPTENLEPPRVARRSRTRALTPPEVARLAAAATEARDKAPPSGRMRDAAELQYTICLTLLTTGIRVSELCQLTIADFEPDAPGAARLRLQRKGGRFQSLPIHPLTRTVLVHYCTRYRSNAPVTGPLFARSQGISRSAHVDHLTPKSVWLMIRKLGVAAGLQPFPSPHTLRATLATELHRQGVLLHRVQDLLGHSDPSTTALYVKHIDSAREAPSTRLQLETGFFSHESTRD
jgi:integrase/recombinase XerD